MVMKQFFLMALTVGVLGMPSAYAAEKITDDLKFDIKDWGQPLLSVHEIGPRILPKDFAIELKPYPANTSDETASELQALKTFAAEERTPEQVETIKHENVLVPITNIFAENGFYDFNTHPIVNSLLSTVERDIAYFTLDQKLKFQRPRPTQLDSDLTTVIPVPPHSAYPSGHSGETYAAALMLSEVDPANADKYKQLAVDVAHRREIAGVHYPSDSEAGRALATQVVSALLKTDDIQKRIALAKKEWTTSSTKMSEQH